MKKLFILLFIMLILTSCTNQKKIQITSDTLYVDKVENLTDDFIFGMDASIVPSLEKSGVIFYNYDNEQEDVFKILKDNGFNYIRVRVWNDPFDADGNGYGGGNSDINNAIEIGKRASKYGLKLLVDFHYSDFWADPGKQMCPKAWQEMDIDTKAEALYEYTKDSLNKLKEAKVDVGMVSLGNETNGAMAGEKIWANILKLMIQGSKATREVFPKALISVHFANPENYDTYLSYAKKLDYYALDYDVFSTSYYPYWHGTLDNLSDILSTISTTYNKKVMVAETSYAYTNDDTDFSPNTISISNSIVMDYPFTVQGQANHIRNLTDTLVNKTDNAIGLFYWEGCWISVGGSSKEENSLKWEEFGSGWAASYAKEYDPNDAGKYYGGSACDNQALFDQNGKALESLKVFSLLKNGNIVDIKVDALKDADVYIDLNDPIILPKTVYAVMNDNSLKEVEITWDQFDEAKLKENGVSNHIIKGHVDNLENNCFLSLIKYNYLKNYSFEDINDTSWKTIVNKDLNELYIEDKKTDSLSGDKHYHFWSNDLSGLSFDLEQEVLDLNSGKYRYQISIMGGDSKQQNIYAYIKINDEIILTAPMKITSYGNWDTGIIESFEYDNKDSLKVGIHVECLGEGSGAWGKIDDAMLNSIGD